MEEFVRSGEVKDSVPDSSTYIASGNFTLEPGQSATFRFRIVLSTDKLDANTTENLFNQWTAETL